MSHCELHNSIMASFKFILVLVLAIGATQAAPPQAEPKDIRDVVDKLVEIVKIIISALDDGITKVDPIVQGIGAQLEPSFDALLKSWITIIRKDVDGVTQKITEMSDAVTKGLADLDSAAGKCADDMSASGKFDKVLFPVLKALTDTFNKYNADHKSEWQADKAEVSRILSNWNKNLLGDLAAQLDCVLKKKDVEACLWNQSNIFWKQARIDSTDTLLSLQSIMERALGIAVDVMVTADKPMQQFHTDARPVWQEFGKCVESS